MAKYYLTNKAVDDLEKIWDYTFETWSENQAEKYYNELILACEKIAKNPKLGKAYFKAFPNLFGLHLNRHIIFYRKENLDFIEITRFLHESMDLEKRLAE